MQGLKSAGSISLKMLATFSTKKIVKITAPLLWRAMLCCTLASEDGTEGDICHGERWGTGPGLSSPLEFAHWTRVGQSSLNVQTCLRVKPPRPHTRGWPPEVLGLCSSSGNLLFFSGGRQSCICSAALKLQIFFLFLLLLCVNSL